MVFSSVIFIFAFLPICLFFYYVVFWKSRNFKNVFLLISSLVFYAWGEPYNVLLMIFSIISNWFFGLMIKNNESKSFLKKMWLTVAVFINILVLVVFKYSTFVVDNFNYIFKTAFSVPSIALPIGISFFTFQAMSYVIDVYRGTGQAQKNPMYVGVYISLFPQLIAGPIVRYETIENQIADRKESIALFSNGIERFVEGLAKKVILANSLSIIADNAFNNTSKISSSMAWLGLFCYTLQIYFDFSGYSDMAIGLGKMFGFQFEENFRYPYISKSVSEFWRRWHISMGTWFRDYVYFPLGGSRVPKPRMILNLFVVWLLTGLWHGADWTFVLWGIFFFVIIVFEKLTKYDSINNNRVKYILHCLLTFFLVMMGWVLFRSDNIHSAFEYFRRLFGFYSEGNNITLFFLRNNVYIILLSILFVFPVKSALSQMLSKYSQLKPIIKFVSIILLFVLSIIYVAKSTYSPFIYFNF